MRYLVLAMLLSGCISVPIPGKKQSRTQVVYDSRDNKEELARANAQAKVKERPQTRQRVVTAIHEYSLTLTEGNNSYPWVNLEYQPQDIQVGDELTPVVAEKTKYTFHNARTDYSVSLTPMTILTIVSVTAPIHRGDDYNQTLIVSYNGVLVKGRYEVLKTKGAIKSSDTIAVFNFALDIFQGSNETASLVNLSRDTMGIFVPLQKE